jgi:hypothetical protein
LNHWLAEFNETKKFANINPTHPEVKSMDRAGEADAEDDPVSAASNLKRVDRLLA